MNTCINCERFKSEISILEADIARLTAECETEAKAAAIALKNADEWSGKLDIVEAERDELQRRLDAALGIPEPAPPCPCKPWSWRGCTCGAYRDGKIDMAQIDAYSEAAEMWESFRRALAPEENNNDSA